MLGEPADQLLLERLDLDQRHVLVVEVVEDRQLVRRTEGLRSVISIVMPAPTRLDLIVWAMSRHSGQPLNATKRTVPVRPPSSDAAPVGSGPRSSCGAGRGPGRRHPGAMSPGLVEALGSCAAVKGQCHGSSRIRAVEQVALGVDDQERQRRDGVKFRPRRAGCPGRRRRYPAPIDWPGPGRLQDLVADGYVGAAVVDPAHRLAGIQAELEGDGVVVTLAISAVVRVPLDDGVLAATVGEEVVRAGIWERREWIEARHRRCAKRDRTRERQHDPLQEGGRRCRQRHDIKLVVLNAQAGHMVGQPVVEGRGALEVME